MFLTKFSLKRPIAAVVIAVTFVLFGLVSYTLMPVDLLPAINYPIITVVTIYPGAPPEQVDSNVSRHIETAVSGVEGVLSVETTSYNSASLVMVELGYEVSLDESKLKMQEQIDSILSDLPAEAETPIVEVVDIQGVPLISLSVSGDTSSADLSSFVDTNLIPHIERMEGIYKIETEGQLSEEISIQLNPYRMASHGISQSDVTYGLSMINTSIPLGETTYNGKTVSVVSDNVIETVDMLSTVPIKPLFGGESSVLLSDIATVEVAEQKNTVVSTLNSNPNVTVHIYKKSGTNSLDIANNIELAIDELNGESEVIDISVLDNQASFITISIGNVWTSLIVGGMLAVVILFLFLRSVKAAAIIGIAIPVCVVTTIGLMFAMGVPLNIISLGGLAIGVGMVVDNAIVVLESIYKVRDEGGYTAQEAAFEGTKQVLGAVIASTLTTIAVFLPVSFTTGFTKEVFSQLSMTIVLSLSASLLSAITVVPALSVALIPKSEGAIGRGLGYVFEIMERWYGKAVEFTLSVRLLVVLLALLIFGVSISLVFVIGMEFMPPMDQGMVNVNVETDSGTSIDSLRSMAYSIEEKIYTVPHVSSVSTTYGVLVDGSTGISMTCKLVPQDMRPYVTEVAGLMREATDNLEIDIEISEVKDIMNAMFGDLGSIGSPVAVEILADDEETLREATETVRGIVENTSGAINVSTTIDRSSEDVTVTVDARKAAALGLSPMTVSTSVRSAMEGSIPLSVLSDGKELDVRVKFDERYTDTLQTLKQLQLSTYLSLDTATLSPQNIMSVIGGVDTTSVGSVQDDIPLSAIADFSVSNALSTVTKKSGKNYAQVFAFVVDRAVGDVNTEIANEIATLSLPIGVEVSYGGQQSLFTESFEGLVIALMFSVVIVYVVMAVQFNSLLNPLIIMFSLPFAFTGSFIALYLGEQSLNVCSFIGIIMLVGIVVNNAIVLIDRILYLRGLGMPRDKAVVLAATSRMRPILMTALTTILGLVPLMLITGEGTELMRPMAFVVVGGMISSTFLSLVVIPSLYSLTARERKRYSGGVAS